MKGEIKEVKEDAVKGREEMREQMSRTEALLAAKMQQWEETIEVKALLSGKNLKSEEEHSEKLLSESWSGQLSSGRVLPFRAAVLINIKN